MVSGEKDLRHRFIQADMSGRMTGRPDHPQIEVAAGNCFPPVQQDIRLRRDGFAETLDRGMYGFNHLLRDAVDGKPLRHAIQEFFSHHIARAENFLLHGVHVDFRVGNLFHTASQTKMVEMGMRNHNLRDIRQANTDFRQLAVQRIKSCVAVPTGIDQGVTIIALQQVNIGRFQRIIRYGYFELIDTFNDLSSHYLLFHA